MDEWYLAHVGNDPVLRQQFMDNVLKALQGDVNDGILSDWEQPQHNHIVSMTCGAFVDEFLTFPNWQQQFSEIVKASGLLLGPSPWKKEA